MWVGVGVGVGVGVSLYPFTRVCTPAEGLKDTKPADVIKVTYVPSLTTFEEDIDELYPQSSS